MESRHGVRVSASILCDRSVIADNGPGFSGPLSVVLQKKVTQVASMEPVILSEAKDVISKGMLRSAQHDAVGFVVLPI